MKQEAINVIPSGLEIKKLSRQVHITWPDREPSVLDFATIRQNCACSRCRSQGLIGKSPVAVDIDIREANPMGSSGLQFIFSDGHGRGVYPWGYLHAIANGCAQEYIENNGIYPKAKH